MTESLVKPCPLAARMSCTFSTTSFSSVQFSPSIRKDYTRTETSPACICGAEEPPTSLPPPPKKMKQNENACTEVHHASFRPWFRPYSQGCGNKKASHPGRQQRCTFRPTAFRSVQFSPFSGFGSLKLVVRLDPIRSVQFLLFLVAAVQ